jgi:PST family polysaccharide transporter
MQSEPVRYRRTFLLVFDGLVILGLCFTGLFLPLADPLVAVILGPKWDAVTPIFAILAASALCYPLLPATSWLLTSQGRGKDLLRVSGINSSIGIVLIIAGLWFGPLGVAVGYSASIALVKTPIMFFLSGRKGPLRTADLWFALLRQLPVGVSMLVATFAASFMLATASPLVRLLVCASVGLLAGMAAVLLSPPSRRTVKHLYKVFAELRNSRAYQHQ